MASQQAGAARAAPVVAAPYASAYRGGNGTSSILCIASGPQDLAALVDLVKTAGRTAETAGTPEEALERLAEHPYRYCLLLLDGTASSLRVVRAIRAQHPGTAIIGVADPAGTGQLPEALRVGVFDVALRPMTARELEVLLSNAREQAELGTKGTLPPADVTPFGLFGASLAMRGVNELIRLAAPRRCGVFVYGERGTGHEMVARAIHSQGTHPQAAFVKVECATTGAPDLEQTLFGTGRRRMGAAGASVDRVSSESAIARAVGGTLFLEHLPRMPEGLQVRLARLLRDRRALVGQERSATLLDVRPIASTETPLTVLEDGGEVVPDLYEWLSLIRIELPPLRERRADIPALAVHFLKEVCRAQGLPPKTLTRSALTLLAALPWRGNARELRVLLERLVILVPQGIIRLEDVLAQTRVETSVVPFGTAATLREARARFEREYIAAVVQQHHGRMTTAAQVLGIQRTNLYRKMRRLNLVPPRRPSRPA